MIPRCYAYFKMPNSTSNYRDILYNQYLSLGFQKINSENFTRTAFVYDVNFRHVLSALHKDAAILDIGCGMGHFLYYLKSKGYSNFLGVDIGSEQIQFCVDHVSRKVKLINNLLEFLGTQEDGYDLIVMNDSLEHFNKEEVMQILRGVFLSLKVNGTLFIKTPNMGNIFAASSRYIDFTHEVGFTEISLDQLLKSAGFTQIRFLNEALFISSWYKRCLFFCLREIYFKLLKFMIFLDRPGDNYPTIYSKNIIAIAKK